MTEEVKKEEVKQTEKVESPKITLEKVEKKKEKKETKYMKEKKEKKEKKKVKKIVVEKEELSPKRRKSDLGINFSTLFGLAGLGLGLYGLYELQKKPDLPKQEKKIHPFEERLNQHSSEIPMSNGFIIKSSQETPKMNGFEIKN